MIVRFSSTVERVVGAEPSLMLMVRPIAGIENVELDGLTRLRRADGSDATWTELRPGCRVAVCGEDNGTATLLAHDLVLHPVPSLVSEGLATLSPARQRGRRLIPFFGLNLVG